MTNSGGSAPVTNGIQPLPPPPLPSLTHAARLEPGSPLPSEIGTAASVGVAVANNGEIGTAFCWTNSQRAAINFACRYGLDPQGTLNINRREVRSMSEITSAALPLNVKNLVGQRFARLVVERYDGQWSKTKGAAWLCRCDCGGTKRAHRPALISGDCKSCGCLDREYRASLVTHGGTYTAEFRIFTGIRTRTSNPNSPGYAKYGALGVRLLFEDFESFFACLGPRPSTKHSVDRFPNKEGHYEAGNVRWATQKEQCRNKRNNRLLTDNGETLPIAAWTERRGFKKNTIRNRLVSGWSVAQAIDTPEG